MPDAISSRNLLSVSITQCCQAQNKLLFKSKCVSLGYMLLPSAYLVLIQSVKITTVSAVHMPHCTKLIFGWWSVNGPKCWIFSHISGGDGEYVVCVLWFLSLGSKCILELNCHWKSFLFLDAKDKLLKEQWEWITSSGSIWYAHFECRGFENQVKLCDLLFKSRRHYPS